MPEWLGVPVQGVGPGASQLLRRYVVRFVSETRCKYVPVSSGPASLRGTVSEINLTTHLLACGRQLIGPLGCSRELWHGIYLRDARVFWR